MFGHWLVLWLCENLLVSVPDVENGAIEGFDDPFSVPVSHRPLVVVQFIFEDIALKQARKTHSSQDKHSEILLEQVAADKIILKLNNVLNEVLHGPNLVVFQCIVHSCGVVKAHSVLLRHFIFEDDGEFRRKVFTVLVTQQMGHALRVETQD